MMDLATVLREMQQISDEVCGQTRIVGTIERAESLLEEVRAKLSQFENGAATLFQVSKAVDELRNARCGQINDFRNIVSVFIEEFSNS